MRYAVLGVLVATAAAMAWLMPHGSLNGPSGLVTSSYDVVWGSLDQKWVSYDVKMRVLRRESGSLAT